MPATECSDNQLLLDAMHRNAGVVLSLPSAGMLRHHRSRFLAVEDEGFWVEMPPNEEPLIDELIASERDAGISFRSGASKVVFASTILKRHPEYQLNADLKIPALRLRHPREIKAIQRRSNYRVRVPEDAGMSVRMWRIAPGRALRDRPLAKQALKATLRDLSIGGMGVMLEGENNQPPIVDLEDRLRIELTTQGVCLLIEGRLRHPAPPVPGETVRAGVQFSSLEKNLEGRQTLATLTRIVGELHREEIRRYRLGLTAP